MKSGDWVLHKNRHHSVAVWNTKYSIEKMCICFIGRANVGQSHCYQCHFSISIVIPVVRSLREKPVLKKVSL